MALSISCVGLVDSVSSFKLIPQIVLQIKTMRELLVVIFLIVIVFVINDVDTLIPCSIIRNEDAIPRGFICVNFRNDNCPIGFRERGFSAIFCVRY